MKLLSRTVFVPTSPGVLTNAVSNYTRTSGSLGNGPLQKVRFATRLTKSDTYDSASFWFSDDDGKTWSDPIPFATNEKRAEGTLRRYPRTGFVDPVLDRYLTITVEGLLPSDHPHDGLKQWYLRYAVSLDGGKTFVVNTRLIQRGSDYNATHPIDGVWIGKNGVMLGDFTCRTIRSRSGKLLVPCQITPIGPDGSYYNPGGGYTYHYAAVLIGTWRDDCTIEWERSQAVENDPARSTRGCIEPTIAQMPDGRILMVMRGSNGGTKDPEHKIPGHRWFSVSNDDGRTWSPVAPWAYHDAPDQPFFSPSSCSQLLTHSNGETYWLGNITPTNPQANSPRNPFVIARVEPRSLQLVRESVFVIDRPGPGEHPLLWLSNFMAHEDRTTGHILLNMSRIGVTDGKDWTSDGFLYRIEI